MATAQPELDIPAGPITGIKVVEVGHGIAGVVLDELGADVVKVKAGRAARGRSA